MRSMAEVTADVTAIVNGGEAQDQPAAAERMVALCDEAQNISAVTGERLPAAVSMILGGFGLYEADRIKTELPATFSPEHRE